MPTSNIKQIVLGIDPGLATTGYGVIAAKKNEIAMITCGAIITTPEQSFDKRLYTIFLKIQGLIKQYKPSSMGIEEIFFAKNTKTALKVGQAKGAIIVAGRHFKLDIREFTPLQVKQALTGYGLASKAQIQKMVCLLLKLKKTPQPDDVTDALAIAICCAQTKKFTKK